MKGMGRVLVGLLLLTASAAAQTNDGATRAAARKLGNEGVEAFQAGQFALANDKLDKAYAVLKVPSLGIWSARALVKQGKLIEAMDRYAEVTRLPPGAGDQAVQKQAQVDAQTELDEAEKVTPNVVIHVRGAEAGQLALKIDGAVVSAQLVGVGTPLNPGQHLIEGISGSKRASVEVTLQLRDHKEVIVDFENATTAVPATSSSAPVPDAAVGAVTPDVAPKTSPNRRMIGWVLSAGGGAALVVGGVAGGLALSKQKSLDSNPACADHDCPRSLSDSVSSLNTLRTVSTVGFIAGGVLAASGVVLLVTAPRQASANQTSLWVSPTFVHLRRTF